MTLFLCRNESEQRDKKHYIASIAGPAAQLCLCQKVWLLTVFMSYH